MNPILRSRTRAAMHRYKVEPYVVAGDVYSEPPHVGRGGWSWYTGSAGWMYRAAVEWILGIRIRADGLHVDPRIPREWPSFEVTLRRESTTHNIRVLNQNHVANGVVRIELDGASLPLDTAIPLATDGSTHAILVTLGRR